MVSFDAEILATTAYPNGWELPGGGLTLRFERSGRLKQGPPCSPGCALLCGPVIPQQLTWRWHEGEGPSVFQEVAEQRGYFEASEWAKGGRTARGGWEEKNVIVTAQQFPLVFVSVRIGPSECVCNAIRFNGQRGRSQCARSSVHCAHAEVLAGYGSHYTEHQQRCETDYIRSCIS